ncbi:beta-propeller domain-containing protein [Geoglobus ahangari]
MKKIVLILSLIAVMVAAGCIDSENQVKPTPTPAETPTPLPEKTPEVVGENVSGLSNLARFKSEEELREYLAMREVFYGYPMFGIAVQKGMPETSEMPLPAPTPTPTPIPTPTLVGDRGVVEKAAERYSGTNVQVKGIDEPDIVKTDGKNIYYSIGMARIYMPRVIMPEYYGKILSVLAFPPDNMSVSFEIPKDGNLLLYKDRLVVLRYNEISGYDKENGKNVWRIDVDGNIVTARLYGDYIFVITRSYLDYYDPCPIEPVRVNGEALEVKCTDIYFPRGISSEVLYTVMKVSPESGEVEKTFSFMGSYGSTVYMSENAIYIAYTKRMGEDEIYFKFLQENRDLLPDDVLSRIEKVMGYDISNQAKFIEIQTLISKYLLTLDKEERLKFENDFWNRMQDFRKEHKREIQRTYIVKVSLNLEPLADGEVPGRMLNQFSMDEYRGYLRVATTFGDENDLYVLDEDLKVVGKITGFGEDERIYAVRFIGDRGYIVTFRETDPFFVIDLSNPANPEIKGELKIPGFSSYLHPVEDHLILGVGREGSYVKLSLFDVSDASNPKEVSKYTLKEYWSEVLYNHHAFLMDSKHGIFFLPAGNHGYVFSYKDGLKLVKAIDVPAVRAIYIDDFLYILGDSIAVYDENTWERVAEFRFE